VPIGASACVAVVTTTLSQVAQSELIASPLNPNELIDVRSSNVSSFDV
jgi:hypothetical protein